MRTKLALYNTIVSLISQFILLILSMIFPRLIIMVFGSEVNGLTASINQVLNIVNLLQAGVVGASIYDMYKPIAEKNNRVLGSIFYSSKKYFSKLSVIFFVFSVTLIPIFLINSNNNISFIESILSVIILSANGALIFKYTSPYDIIISAHQKKYILVYSSLLEKFIYYGLLILILFLKTNFIFMYLAMIAGTLIRVIYLKFYFKKNYYSRIDIYKENTDYKVKNQYYLLSNQIIQQIIESAPTLIISSFYGLVTTSVFSLYNMIVSAFKMIFTTIQNSIAASFGDLSTSNKSHAKDIFDITHLLFLNLGQVTSSCMMVLCIPFMKLYSSGITDVDYTNTFLAISMCMLSLTYCIFMPYNMAINTNGEYKSVTKQNLIYGIFFIFLALIFSLFDYVYCIILFALFYLVSSIDRINIIDKKIFKLNKLSHFKRIFLSILMTFIYYSIFKELTINSWLNFILYGLFHVIITGVLVILQDFMFDRKTIKLLIDFIKERI